MKKILMILLVSFTLMIMPCISGFSVLNIKEEIDTQITTKGFSSNPEDAPDWAIGNFTGRWGLDFFGHDWFTIGSVKGFYGKGFIRNIRFGRFQIHYNESGEVNGTLLEGIFFGTYLLGKSLNEETGNKTSFVGLGGYNETHFRWRVMGMHGPTIYMKGIFSEFE